MTSLSRQAVPLRDAHALGSRPTRAQVASAVPGLALLALVLVVPFAWLVWRSLHAGTVAAGGSFTGIDNYVSVLRSPEWWEAIGTTAVLALGLTVAQLVLGVAFTVALWHVTRLWWPARFLALVPAGVGLIVGAHAGRAAVDGGFLTAWFGLDGFSAAGALAGVVLGELWRTTGLVVVLVHAAFEARVPSSLLDAAVADGATSWQRWRRVIWPAVAPALAAVASYRLIDSWRLLEGPLLVREPGSFRTSASALIADNAFGLLSGGPAAAAAVVLVLIPVAVGGIVLGLTQVVRRR
ncbi:MAG: hypothetical protein QM597_08315 [Aeromicrobium sp.]|uniref:carbohydrate ABC transporter permease n=1 Tax=Aeromicrobium sp. TaxID=1871063 RepID=UPI0039E3BB73